MGKQSFVVGVKIFMHRVVWKRRKEQSMARKLSRGMLEVGGLHRALM